MDKDRILAAAAFVFILAGRAELSHAQPFAIEVVDDQTGRGVPLVELTTTGNITYVTDSAGLIAFDEPGLVGQRVHFSVKSHGYEFPKDGFGFRGVTLQTKPGGSTQIKIKRLNIAERLYRVTGQGIYRDTVLLGRKPPLKEPVLNGQVIGSDSVNSAVYHGKMYWFWGDTNRPAYPLGNYHTPGAISPLVSSGELDPERGIELKYFTGDDGFVRPTCKMPGDGPTWIGGLAVLPDAAGRERMLCGYAKIKGSLTTYRRGIALWNDEKSEFEQAADFAPDVPLFPDGHPLLFRDGETEHVLFATPFPLVRVQATAENYQNLADYESFTCLKAGSSLGKPEIDRDDAGRIRFAWKRGIPPLTQTAEEKLLGRNLLQPHERLLHLCDAATGKIVLAHAGSVHWNEYRRRYVMIAVQSYGTSFLGEIWYAEADSPVGPWVYATKIATHDKYSFYNPKQHPDFTRRGSPVLFFEGTYTHTFSGNDRPTPRYDYNQIMYRLDLADERLALPVAVYDAVGKGFAGDVRLRDRAAAWSAAFDSIRFFALDRLRTGTIAFARDEGSLGPADPGQSPLFFALPPDAAEPGISVPLYEYLHRGGNPPIYDLRGDLDLPDYQRCPEPLCRVWPSPYLRQAESP